MHRGLNIIIVTRRGFLNQLDDDAIIRIRILVEIEGPCKGHKGLKNNVNLPFSPNKNGNKQSQ